jgi:hypothetical protein
MTLHQFLEMVKDVPHSASLVVEDSVISSVVVSSEKDLISSSLDSYKIIIKHVSHRKG